MDAEQQAKLIEILSGISFEDMQAIQKAVNIQAEVKHPTLLATRRYQAALKTSADEVTQKEMVEILAAIDDKVATHGALSTTELSALLRKVVGHLATATPPKASAGRSQSPRSPGQ